jgi:hypothetical protein
MIISSKTLRISYGLIGLIALVTTQIHALEYTSMGAINGTITFWKDTLANSATQFISIDIMFLALAVTIWMLMEARRLNISIGWVYILVGTFIGISFAIPLFLIHREIVMNKTYEQNTKAGYLNAIDVICIIGSAAFAVIYTYLTFK